MADNILAWLNQWFNTCVIEKNPIIVEEMTRYNQMHGRIKNHRARAKMVAGLFLRYGILNRNPLQEFEKKIGRLPFPESRYARQISLPEIKARLEQAEIIVFDVWDVVLCAGLDMAQIRAFSECEALHPGISEYGDRDLTKDTASDGFSILYSVVRGFTMDNSEIHRLWDELVSKGKRLYFRNNSCYEDALVQSVLNDYGYRGRFYQGDGKDAVCVVTNAGSDQDVEYRNVNRLGSPYRAYYDYNIVTGLTDRIINLLIHGSGEVKTVFYEYGAACGGILTCGFCQWLNELAQRKEIDLFLFVARDGDIMQKIYQKFYAEHESAYLIFSRFASFELIFGDYPEEYIDKNIKPRMGRKNCDNSVAAILRECGLEFLECSLSDEGLSGTDILNENCYDVFQGFVLKHKTDIEAYFQTSCIAAESYFREVCRRHRNICVVDLGWHGKSIIYLKHFMERKCGMNVEVTGALVGAFGETVVQDYIRKDVINTYAFENDKWRSQGSRNGEQMDYREILCTELLFSSTKDTLLRYVLDENGNTVFLYGQKNENRKAVCEIHKGISDFAEKFADIQNRYGLRVLPRDAYTPLYYTLKNERLCKWIYENYRERENAINGFE